MRGSARSIHGVAIVGVDRRDLPVPDQQLRGDAARQLDRDRVQSLHRAARCKRAQGVSITLLQSVRECEPLRPARRALITRRRGRAEGSRRASVPGSAFRAPRLYASASGARSLEGAALLTGPRCLLSMQHFAGIGAQAGGRPHGDWLKDGYNRLPLRLAKSKHANPGQTTPRGTATENCCTRWAI